MREEAQVKDLGAAAHNLLSDSNACLYMALLWSILF